MKLKELEEKVEKKEVEIERLKIYIKHLDKRVYRLEGEADDEEW